MNDCVDRLTPLGLMVLALLDEGPMHPYEMIRLMRQRRDDRFVAVTNGTVYHTVARLERDGLVTEVGVDREGNRPERTTYAVTEPGRRAVKDWVRRELPRTDRPSQFRIALAESHNLDRAEVIHLLRAHGAALADNRRMHTEGRRRALDKGVPEQFLLELEREETLLAAELGWLEHLLPRLERHDFPWGRSESPLDTERYLSDRKAARQ